jgi:hypothetical protein
MVGPEDAKASPTTRTVSDENQEDIITHFPIPLNSNVCVDLNLSLLDDDDEVFFAYCYPFTYTDCCNHVSSICTTMNRDRIRRTTLCKTLAGNE